MVTGASDIYALHVEANDGGLEAFEQMTKKRGLLPADTPRARTGNGGLHILFSLSASLEAGLKDGRNKARISFEGRQLVSTLGAREDSSTSNPAAT